MQFVQSQRQLIPRIDRQAERKLKPMSGRNLVSPQTDKEFHTTTMMENTQLHDGNRKSKEMNIMN